jgi:hypothetical protein
MQVTQLDLLGDLGDQIPVAVLNLGIRRQIDDLPRPHARKGAVMNSPEFEYASPAEIMEEMVEFTTISPRLERRMRAELGPERFSRLIQLLFRVWQTDRMI